MSEEINKIIDNLEGCIGMFDYLLTPIESNLLVSYIRELQQENEKLHHYKALYQSLKRQKEELRSWLEENIICYENSQNTNLGEYERKIHFDLYNDVSGKLEELEGVSNE